MCVVYAAAAVERVALRGFKALVVVAGLQIVLLGLPASAADGTSPRIASSIEVTTNYYTVTGTTAAELIKSKAQARPRKDKGPFDAYTDWNIHWTFKCRQRGDRFAIDSLEIRTTVAVTLPRWVAPAEASRDLVERWQQYVRGLGLHELGHLTLARLATAELQQQVAALKPYPTAKELTEAAGHTGTSVVEKYRQKEGDYDLETGHGAKQGARFGR
jgi:predicted secreted Zn-dependent protease